MAIKDFRICVVGLGYVGLPLAVAFGRTSYPTFGYDVNHQKVDLLLQKKDPTGELSSDEMNSTSVTFSADPSVIEQANVVIAAIPTPVNTDTLPDLEPLRSASQIIGKHLKPGSIVVYESTVYPGVTEEFCGPILEKASGLRLGLDFQLGYSPERINPGDKQHTLAKITKIVSGSNEETLKLLKKLYGSIVKAGIYEAPSIKVAEAAKVIENIQRDLNIGLMNELSLIFKKMDIDTFEVLKAAETKWNFHSYRPGLVGGHCIGVDPYYLTYKAQQLGYKPEIILAARHLNDSMASIVAGYVLEGLRKLLGDVKGTTVLVMGVTFKENVPDLRNSKCFEMIQALQKEGMVVMVYDPLVDRKEIEHQCEGLSILQELKTHGVFDALVLCSPHDRILNEIDALLALGRRPLLFIDLKGKCRDRLRNAPQIIYRTL